MEPILTTTLIALFFYLVLIFTANKLILRQFRVKSILKERNELLIIYFILAVNINIICALILTQDHLMNYMTYLIKDDFGFLNVLSAGSIILITNAVLLFISYFLGSLLSKILRVSEFLFMQPVLWVTLNLILLNLTIVYYEAYITTHSVTIF